jgi:hypothetical protein
VVSVNLSAKLEKLETKEEFCKFVYDMLEDYRDNLTSWENKDLPSFLEAVAAWSEDLDGFYANQGKEIPRDVNWKVFAEILYSAKLYE